MVDTGILIGIPLIIIIGGCMLYGLLSLIFGWWPFTKITPEPELEPEPEPEPAPLTQPPIYQFEKLDGVNLMKGKKAQNNPNIENYGLFETQKQCENTCGADKKCEAYTWVKDSTSDYFKTRCYGMYTDEYDQSKQVNHYSGIKK